MKINIHANPIWHMALVLLCASVLLASCSDNSYVNAIPSTATGIMKIDAMKVKGGKVPSVLTKYLSVEDVAACGIDWSRNIFLFETIDGNFGMCAKVKSKSDLDNTFAALENKGVCGKQRKQGDFTFSDIDNAWAVGYSDVAIVVIGPVSTVALADTQRSIAKMLRQDADESIQDKPMFSKLDSMESEVAMVAKVQALPEKFAAPFVMGAPKDADASQVLVAVDFSKEGGILKMHGETFSFNNSINAALKKANSTYRKIGGDYFRIIPKDCRMGLFANVDGKQFLPMLQGNKPLQALLVGLNTAVDFDNIIRSIDGDFVFMSMGDSSDDNKMAMYARVGQATWAADVDYWKQSCADGSSITGGKGAWCYNSGDMHFAFGLMGDTFYGATDKCLIPTEGKHNVHPIDSDIQNAIKGSRMAMLLNVSSVKPEGENAVGLEKIAKDMLGDVKAVIYVLK